MTPTIKPPKLHLGDVIGFYSPSSPATSFAPKRFRRAKKYLQDKGFQLKAGDLTGKSAGYRSGTISERVEELNNLIRDPDVRCIMSTIGGMNSNSLLPYIDYDALRKDPKILIGYSDATAILLSVYAKTGLLTFYGPALVASFGEFEPLVSITYHGFENMLATPSLVPYTYKMPEFWSQEFINWEDQDRAKEKFPNQWLTVEGGKVQGRVMGGNLNTFHGFWGSEYMPDIREGDILFIEDSLHTAATVERSFSLLKASGIFDKVAGIILGKHELFDDQGTNVKPHQLLLEVLNGQKLPILAEFDCCHTHPMFTLPLGVQIELDATNKRVTVLEKWLS